MGSWKEIYKGGGFMTLKQLGSRTVIGQIESIEPKERTFKKGSATKLEATITGLDNPVILNQDSCKKLAEAFGEDFDDWVGEKVKVAKGRVAFGEGEVPAILVTPAKGKK